jgi:hypothetical protein
MENKRIITASNIILLLLLCTSVGALSRLTGNGECFLMSYVIIAINIFVYAIVTKSGKINKYERAINLILCYLYIMSTCFSLSNRIIVNVLIFCISAIIYVVCCWIISKFVNESIFIGVLCFSLIGIMLITCGQYIISAGECSKTQEYEFSDEVTYNKCKQLYKDNYSDAYIILDYSDKALYLRTIGAKITSFVSFDTAEECQAYIEKHTIGKIDIPVLGGECKFDDDNLKVTYHPLSSYQDTLQKMRNKNIYAICCVEIWMILVVLVGAIYEKKRKDSN